MVLCLHPPHNAVLHRQLHQHGSKAEQEAGHAAVLVRPAAKAQEAPEQQWPPWMCAQWPGCKQRKLGGL